MILIAVIAYIFWAVLGLFFWIPLLFRVIAGFCATLIYNMVVNNPDNIQSSKLSLELAIGFYANGFQNIHSTLYKPNNASNNNKRNEIRILAFIAQVIWTLLFWALTIFPFINFDVIHYIKTLNYSSTDFIIESDKLLSIHDTTSAIKMMTTAINKDEFNAELYFKRGTIYYNSSEHKNAVLDLECAMNLDSNQFGKDPSIPWKIASIYAKELDQPEKAITYYNITLKYSPNYTQGYLERGICYDKLNLNDYAIQDYDAALRLNPYLGIAYSNKAGILYDIGLKKKPVNYMTKQ